MAFQISFYQAISNLQEKDHANFTSVVATLSNI